MGHDRFTSNIGSDGRRGEAGLLLSINGADRSEARLYEAEREAEEFRLKLKSRAGAERKFARRLAARRHRGRGVGVIEK